MKNQNTENLSHLFLGETGTYTCDLDLFQKLGLKTFKTNSQKKLFIGTIKIRGYKKGKVKISVTCMLAQFWSFEVETIEGHKFNIETGSGTLSDYWPSVLKVVDGCFVVKPIKTSK